jgi:hypothetical protein
MEESWFKTGADLDQQVCMLFAKQFQDEVYVQGAMPASTHLLEIIV